jgi:alkaline phosphatase D
MEVPEVQTRRQFVTRAGTAAAAAVFAPQSVALGASRARLARGGRFPEGVMSGDPTPQGVTLWTRVADVGGRTAVELEVARDAGFGNVCARARIGTSGHVNHNVKARVSGLAPHEQYFYRFSTSTKDGPVGRFRTALPPDSRQPVHFAFWSCQEYTHGFFNAHELMADDDLDFVVCLGDYVYSEAYHSVAGGTGVRDDHIGRSLGRPGVVREAVTLADYRAKYELYRSDASLRRLQSRFPFVVLWDDHEVSDNYAGGAAGGGLPPERAITAGRKRRAYRAFFEATPYFAPKGTTRLYRRLRFGRTVELIVMDQRQYRADQPCGDAISVPACPGYDDPRTFLGPRQMRFVKHALRSSKATWKVLANEVMAMPVRTLGDSILVFDSWDGYPREREELLGFLKAHRIEGAVFVTGDIHAFIAGDVRTDAGRGQTVATEFVAGSITSTGAGEMDLPAGGGAIIKGNDADPHTDPAILNALLGLNPWVVNADIDHHGYGRVKATRDAFECEMVRLQTIKRRSAATLPRDPFRYRLERGRTLQRS